MADRDAAGPIFTDEDVRRVLAEERGDGEQGGWSLANQSDNVEVWRKAEEGVSIHLLKARVCSFVLSLFVWVCILLNFPSSMQLIMLPRACRVPWIPHTQAVQLPAPTREQYVINACTICSAIVKTA